MCYTGRGDKEKSRAQMCSIIGCIYTVFDFSVTSKKKKKNEWMKLFPYGASSNKYWPRFQCLKDKYNAFLFTGNCKTLFMLWHVLFLTITLVKNMHRKLKKFLFFSQFGHPSHIPGLIVSFQICGRVQHRTSAPTTQICSIDVGTNAAWDEREVSVWMFALGVKGAAVSCFRHPGVNGFDSRGG